MALLGASNSMVCACPTTERNLGDGIVCEGVFDALAMGETIVVRSINERPGGGVPYRESWGPVPVAYLGRDADHLYFTPVVPFLQPLGGGFTWRGVACHRLSLADMCLIPMPVSGYWNTAWWLERPTPGAAGGTIDECDAPLVVGGPK